MKIKYRSKITKYCYFIYILLILFSISTSALAETEYTVDFQEKLSLNAETINETSNLNLKSIFHSIFSLKPYIKHENGLINWLKARINIKTGLLESFFPTKDFNLKNQALTIDQAFAGIVFLTYNQIDIAKTIADFLVNNWTANGYPIFFNSITGNEGIEKTAYLGHNAWVGIFLCHLYSKTSDEKYLTQVKKIIEWSLKLKTIDSAVAMSSEDNTHIALTNIYSTESNIELYALITNYIQYTSYEERSKLKYKLRQIRYYLQHNAKINSSKDSIKLIRGGINEKLDLTQSIEAYSYLLLAIPQNILKVLNLPPEEIKNVINESFSAKDDNIKGFDFTDSNERKKLNREPIICFKASFSALLAFYNLQSNIPNENLVQECNELIKNLENGIFYVKPGHFAIPYATKENIQLFTTPSSFKTPKDGELNKAGAVSSVCWYLFCANKVNPFYFKKIELNSN